MRTYNVLHVLNEGSSLKGTPVQVEAYSLDSVPRIYAAHPLAKNLMVGDILEITETVLPPYRVKVVQTLKFENANKVPVSEGTEYVPF